MKRNLIVKSIVVSSVLSGLLTGCGSSTTNNDSNNIESNKQTSISGKAIDGYLQNAVVCLDLNDDGYCQAKSEPLTTTLADGSFKLNITQAQRDNANFDEAMLLIFGGVDVDTGRDFSGKLMAPNDGSALLNVSPITTIVAKNVQKALKAERGLTKEQIKEKIKEARKKVAIALEIDEDEVGQDPIERKAKGDDKLIRKALKIQKSLEAQLAAAQTANKDLKEKIDDLYEALADGLDDMQAGEVGLDKLYERAAQKALFQETLRGQSPEQMIAIADKIGQNLDDAFDHIEDGDLEKIAAITRDDMDNIREGAKDGDLSTVIEGIVYVPTNDWLRKYIEQDLRELGIKPTIALVNKLKEVYKNDVRAGVLLNKADKLKESADPELKNIYKKILLRKEQAKQEKEAEEAKYSDEIVKIEAPMSIYNLSYHNNGYEKVTFTTDNKLTFTEYAFDQQSGSFVEDTQNDQGKDYVLVNGKWTDISGDESISIDDKGVISLPSHGQTATLTREKDLVGTGFFVPFLDDKISMPEGAKGYMVKINQVEDNYELDDKVNNFNSIGDFIAAECGDKWFDGFDNPDVAGGISFSGVLDANGQYSCDPTKTKGKLSAVIQTSEGTKVRNDAGSWKIVTLPETEQKALVVEPYTKYRDEHHEQIFFTIFDDGSGSALWRGNMQKKGDSFAFPTMNKIAMDTLIASTIKAFEDGTLSMPNRDQSSGSQTQGDTSIPQFELNGLTWTQVSPIRKNAVEAAAMCRNLGADWRLPTIDELGENAEAIKTSGILLKEAQTSVVWSSSTSTDAGLLSTGKTFGFWFDPAENDRTLQENMKNYYVTCVK